jgi:PPK2 family polyphosphate:nucleotide phosphotransferase
MATDRTRDLTAFTAHLRVEPGDTVDLDAIDPSGTPGFDGDRGAAEAELEALRDELTDFQERLWAERGQALLIVLQALDGGGKDGTIRKVFTAFNPQGTRVTGFGVPTEEELAHDFLWRVHPHTPGKGRIGIFNRSHYEDVLVVRVNELAPKSVWSGRYELINAFEQSLAAANTTILKFMLHISRDEQRERFEARLAERAKRWKFRLADLEARAKWSDYMAAYTDVLERCSTKHAPWFVIPADHKWYRDLAVARIVTDAARRMNPDYPEPEEDLSGVVVTD